MLSLLVIVNVLWPGDTSGSRPVTLPPPIYQGWPFSLPSIGEKSGPTDITVSATV